jgi:hypothetical protein
MSSELEPDQGEALDLAAAEVRADASDLQALIGALAARLEDALPRLVAVKRRRVGGFRSQEKEIRSILLDVCDARFELVRTPAGFDCTRHAVVRGVTLKRERRTLAQWIAEVVATVMAQADLREQDRLALEELVR